MTLVSRTNDQSAGQRRPHTATATISRLMLAALISVVTGAQNTTIGRNGPVSANRARTSAPRRRATKTSNETAWAGIIAWAAAGEYRNAYAVRQYGAAGSGP